MTLNRLLPALACLAALTPGSVAAQDNSQELDRCLAQAGQTYGVSAELLRAIAAQESGLKPKAVHRNANGTVDMGLMQINSSWFPTLARHGIKPAHLLDACTNANVGAWILANAIRQYGDSWRAVGSFHSKTAVHNQRYAWAVYRRLTAARASSEQANAEPTPSTR